MEGREGGKEGRKGRGTRRGGEGREEGGGGEVYSVCVCVRGDWVPSLPCMDSSWFFAS